MSLGEPVFPKEDAGFVGILGLGRRERILRIFGEQA